jgi:cysteine desulfurase/selenocysteine lyase
MPRWQGGGDMIETVTFEHSTYAPVPHKFEAGTPDIAGVIGLDAALQWTMALDRDAVVAHERELLATGFGLLAGVAGVTVLSPREHNVGILTFVVDGVHAHDVASLLDQDGVCVRAGHHCTQPLHRRLGLPATVRASLGVYSERWELEALATSLNRIREMFR